MCTVSASLGRVRLCDMVPCITPRSRRFATSRARLIHGIDCLHLQNIWYGTDRDANLLSLFGDRFLVDMAGNAMEGCCLSAAILASVVLLSSCTDAAGVAPPSPSGVADAGHSDDDDVCLAWHPRKRSRAE